jgi:predicted nuclease of restriction endonuclease-like RecB superfamily
VLASSFGAEREPTPRPREIRAAVFAEAAASGLPRSAVLESVAARFGTTPDSLEAGLFADLGARRPLAEAEARPAVDDVLLRSNLLLAQGLLFRASRVRVALEGNARPVVRLAKLRGLICQVEYRADGCVIAASGPFAMFRHTLVYGRALASLVPALAWCRSAKLSAEICLPDGPAWLQVDQSAPIFPSAEPRRFDSSLEERFARDFGRLAPEWEIVREPAAVALPRGGLLFPDFLLRDRQRTANAWLLEIAGFWTPDYVRRKLEGYREARLPNLILCVDADRNVSAGELPEDARVIRYRRRVDAREVLNIVRRAAQGEAPVQACAKTGVPASCMAGPVST